MMIAAMSGGVDSSVAASIYLKKGYEVIGVTLQMKKQGPECEETTKSCCGTDDNQQVKLVAEKLGVPHYFIEVNRNFDEKVLRYAWDEYRGGRTPNPCIQCNRFIKFGDEIFAFAQKVGAEGIVTGHYGVIDRSNPERARLYRGENLAKDQTYFLSGLSQEQINFCHMPLGDLDKEQVREMAKELELPNFAKKDSQDACFGYVGETFASTLSRYFKEKGFEGKMLDDEGQVLRCHEGLHLFTIGQRKHLGVALGKPAYVIDIDGKTKEIVVSTDKSKLLSESFSANEMNWLDFDGDELDCLVQTRYRQKLRPARVKKVGDRALVQLEKPLASVTPGQRLAIYIGEQLVAGGWIE